MTQTTTDFQETPIGTIPADWKVTTIGKLGKIVTGTTPSTKVPEYYGGSYKLISPASLDDQKYIRTAHRWLTEAGLNAGRELPKDTVLVSCIGYIGKIGLTADERSISNQQINAIICNEETNPHFTYYLLKYHQNYLKRFARKTTVPILNKTNFQKIKIPLPPLPEQRGIARVLNAIQRAIAAQDDLIAAAREVKRALMHRLFTYGAGAEPAPTKETEIGEIPEHWEVARLGELCEKPQYGYTASATEQPLGLKFLRITDIQEDNVNWATVPYCEIDKNKIPKYQLRQGDILFARIGATTGKSYCVAECPPAIFASYLIRVRTKSRLHFAFLKHIANSEAYWKQINASKGGRLKQGVNIPILKGLLLPLPYLSEQQETANILDTADNKITAEKQRKAALQELFKSMLHELMTGRIRVKDLEW